MTAWLRVVSIAEHSALNGLFCMISQGIIINEKKISRHLPLAHKRLYMGLQTFVVISVLSVKYFIDRWSVMLKMAVSIQFY